MFQLFSQVDGGAGLKVKTKHSALTFLFPIPAKHPHQNHISFPIYPTSPTHTWTKMPGTQLKTVQDTHAYLTGFHIM